VAISWESSELQFYRLDVDEETMMEKLAQKALKLLREINSETFTTIKKGSPQRE
jgi:hypothetical protein